MGTDPSDNTEPSHLISDLVLFSTKDQPPEPNNPLPIEVSPVANSLVSGNMINQVLHAKEEALATYIQAILSDIQGTRDLEKKSLAYLDYNIVRVENHLLQADFWQNRLGRQDVMPLRSQMQQQLFQLEREKVEAQIQIHSQLLNLSRQLRDALRDLTHLETQHTLFGDHGRPL